MENKLEQLESKIDDLRNAIDQRLEAMMILLNKIVVQDQNPTTTARNKRATKLDSENDIQTTDAVNMNMNQNQNQNSEEQICCCQKFQCLKNIQVDEPKQVQQETIPDILKPYIGEIKQGDRSQTWYTVQSNGLWSQINQIQAKSGSKDEENQVIKISNYWNLTWVKLLMSYVRKEISISELLKQFEKHKDKYVQYVSVRTSRFAYYLLKKQTSDAIELIEKGFEYWVK